jgi:sugar/nucleoside kinase (ribokinase family)
MLIAVLGDCLLDVMVRPLAPMRPGGDAPARIRMSPGGQGANVAVRLARRGASVRLVAPMADDLVARMLRQALAREAVDLATLSASDTGSVVALLDVDGERTMWSDRVPLATDDLHDLLADAGWVHVSGYALRDASASFVSDALAALRPATRVSIGGGSLPPDRAEASSFLAHVERAAPELLLLARQEAEALLDRAEPLAGETGGHRPAAPDRRAGPAALAGELAGRLPGVLVIVTAGADGSAAAGSMLDQPIAVAAFGSELPVVDATGAGDGYAAGLIDELAHLGSWPPTAEQLRVAMRTGSRVGGLVARVEGAQGRVADEASLSAGEAQ